MDKCTKVIAGAVMMAVVLLVLSACSGPKNTEDASAKSSASSSSTSKIKVGSVVVDVDPTILKAFEFSDFKKTGMVMELTVLWKDNDYRPSGLYCGSYNKKGVKLGVEKLRFGVDVVNMNEPTRAAIYLTDGDVSLVKIGPTPP